MPNKIHHTAIVSDGSILEGEEIEIDPYSIIGPNVTIGENLGLMDYTAAVKLSGSRFSVLKSELAILNRALSNYMLDLHSRTNGYKEVLVPELVRSNTLYGTILT